jgi:hypothetical protein
MGELGPFPIPTSLDACFEPDPNGNGRCVLLEGHTGEHEYLPSPPNPKKETES